MFSASIYKYICYISLHSLDLLLLTSTCMANSKSSGDIYNTTVQALYAMLPFGLGSLTCTQSGFPKEF